jgi:signal transduction histidine kinase
LGLLFRSWRAPVSTPLIVGLTLAVLIIGGVCESLRQIGHNFHLRTLLIGSTSILISAWELIELAKNIRKKRNTALRSVFFIILLQITFSILTVILANVNPSPNIAHVADNNSPSNIGFWITMTLHVIVYVFIGSYLYQKVIINERRISKEKFFIENLLAERESMIASLVMANRAASVGALSAALAHELSQPLSASMLNSSVLLRQLEQPIDTTALQKIASAIKRENVKASNILLTLKDIFTSNHTQLKHENLVEVIARLRPVLEPHTNKKNIHLIISSNHQNIGCLLNFSEFQQVIVNILNNAIDALESVQSAYKEIRIELDQSQTSATIRISDNGPGIALDDRTHIFELFKSQKSSGMGFGLWLCQHIIEQRHRGTISLEDTPGPGACFAVHLPLA